MQELKVETFNKTAGETIKEMVERYNELRKEMMGKLETNFSTLFDEFFEQVPEVKYISWCQWVPGFNDGDPCVFRMGDFNFILADSLNEDDEPITVNDLLGESYPFDNNSNLFQITREFGDWYKEKYPQDVEKWNKELQEILGERGPIIVEKIKEMQTILNQIPEDIYENIFDSNASIVIEKGKTHTEEYDCGY